MDAQALIIWLIVGAIAGWLAGMVVKGGGYGLIGDIIVGIVGGLIAGWLLPQIGIVIGGGIIAAIINAFIGAVILLIILRLGGLKSKNSPTERAALCGSEHQLPLRNDGPQISRPPGIWAQCRRNIKKKMPITIAMMARVIREDRPLYAR
jgi:uncharacterized membrane protein YeaQ/YmgE (transglycosylase-associated protein family)